MTVPADVHDAFDLVEEQFNELGDCLWHIYRMIGKLGSRVYLLSAPRSSLA